MADSFITAIIHIHEQLTPISTQGVSIHSIAMVLTSHITTLRTYLSDWLVMRAMTILELVDAGTAGFSQELITHADTADRLTTLGHLTTEDGHSLLAHVRVTRSVRKEQSIEIQFGIVVIPRNTDYFHVPIYQTTNDIVFDTTVNKYHFLPCPFVIANHLFTAHLFYEVHAFIVSRRDIICIIIKDDLSHHHTMLSKDLRKLSGINTCDARNLFPFQPISQAFASVPMAILFTVIRYNDR